MKKDVLIIVGPTAVGKTDLSIALAQALNGEIVSADSRQIYRFMDIGTAKPTGEQLAAVPHHFIDICTPEERYSAGRFSEEARATIVDILSRGKVPLVVGGSGLYIRALVDGLAEPPVGDETVKRTLKSRAAQDGIQSLFEMLKKIDPVTAKKLHQSDSQRIMRALEVYEITGEPFSSFIQKPPKPAQFSACFVGLNRERTELYRRIETRVNIMLESGLVDEVKMLRSKGFHRDLNALQTVGYKEVFSYLADEIDYDHMVALIKQKSRNYAKRQLTWFRKDKRIVWVDLSRNFGSAKIEKMIENIYCKGDAGLPDFA